MAGPDTTKAKGRRAMTPLQMLRRGRPGPPHEILVGLSNQLARLDVRVDLSLLDGAERSRFEQLVERAAGSPGLFQNRRAEADARTKAAELATRARRPSAR